LEYDLCIVFWCIFGLDVFVVGFDDCFGDREVEFCVVGLVIMGMFYLMEVDEDPFVICYGDFWVVVGDVDFDGVVFACGGGDVDDVVRGGVFD